MKIEFINYQNLGPWIVSRSVSLSRIQMRSKEKHSICFYKITDAPIGLIRFKAVIQHAKVVENQTASDVNAVLS